MKKIVLVILLSLSASFASAEGAFLETCHNLPNNETRLNCYDQETGYKPITAESISSTEPTVGVGTKDPSGKQWQHSSENSALDNRQDVWLRVRSTNTEGNAIGSPIRATLWVRCMENKTNIFIGFDRYTTDNQSVKFKLDEGAIKKQWMEVMRGGDGIGVWSGRRAIPLIKQMFGKEKLVVAYDTYTGPVEFTFDISGLNERIDPLAKACQWKP